MVGRAFDTIVRPGLLFRPQKGIRLVAQTTRRGKDHAFTRNVFFNQEELLLYSSKLVNYKCPERSEILECNKAESRSFSLR